MSKFLTFLILLTLLAVVQAAALALVAGLLLALLYFFATRPLETLLCLGSLALLGLASARPIAFIAALGVVGVAVVWARHRERSGNLQFPFAGRASLRRTPRLEGNGPR